jgi:hypothetical protein
MAAIMAILKSLLRGFVLETMTNECGLRRLKSLLRGFVLET